MAYVLSLRPHSPLKRSFSDNPYLQSYSPLKDALLAPLGDITARNTSACSLYSLGSDRAGSWARGNENTPPLTSQSLLNLVPGNSSGTFGTLHVDHGPRKRACGVDRPSPSISRVTAPSNPYSRRVREAQHVAELFSSSESSDEAMEVDHDHLEEADIFDLYEAIQVPLPEGRFTDNTDNTCSEPRVQPDQIPLTVVDQPQPFRRWLSTLRRRHVHRQRHHTADAPRSSFDTNHREADVLQQSLRRNSESMSSSMGCVTTVKSASITIGSTSIAPRSDHGFHAKLRIGNRSSHYSDARRSLDSHRGPLGPIVDESAWLRSLQRRKIVEELIASEEGYIADLKVLINVRCSHNQYCTILTAPS
jgi:hypothetical protein